MEGAIGSRGPGETQLETDRRLIGQRIARLKKQIEAVRRHRALQRSRRDRQGVPVVALVGYTNAGKSSLMRALAGANVLAADAPFATLDPVTRRVGSGGSEAFLLTDTVGFMQKLPPQLISAFRATLEELESAELLLHVVDVTSSAACAQAETVIETLSALGLANVPVLTVLNKVDGLLRPDGTPVESEAELADARELNPLGPSGEAMCTSATKGWGVDALRDRLLYEFFGAEAHADARAYVAAK
jgi:GTP-binding protein HflX